MGEPRRIRILVVTGSRAIDVDRRPRRWAKRERAAAFGLPPDRDRPCSAAAGFAPDVVAHGFARGPDAWADELAAYLEVPRVHFALSADRPWYFDAKGVGRLARGAELYTYDGTPKTKPLARNEAMMSWAAAKRDEGHVVLVLALRAPWTNTQGTRHAMDRASRYQLAVTAPELPSDAWPEEDPRGEGQHGA